MQWYWYTPIREVIATLALTNLTNAKQLLYDAITWANADPAVDNAEVISKDGKFRCTQYVASAGGILGAVLAGGTDPTPTVAELVAPFAIEEMTSLSDGSPAMKFTGPWDPQGGNPDFSSGAAKLIHSAGGLTIPFRSTTTDPFQWFSVVNPDLGQAEGRMDGGAWVPISYANASAVRDKKIYDSGPLTVGNHTFELRWVSGYIIADRAQVGTTVVTPDPPTGGTFSPAQTRGLHTYFSYKQGVNFASNGIDVLSWQAAAGNRTMTLNADRTTAVTAVPNKGMLLQGQEFSMPSVWTGAQARTLVVVYEDDTITGEFVHSIAGQSDSGANNGTWFMLQKRTRYVVGDPYVAGYGADAGGGKTAPTAGRKFAAATYDGTTLRLYGTVGGTVTLLDSSQVTLNTTGTLFRVGRDVQHGTNDPAGGVFNTAMQGYVPYVVNTTEANTLAELQQLADFFAAN
ncbi:hypothetical protein [Hymenobacter fodinae]|uniref:Uncharacterized protein n=1 Tax=Hymenobacter fodinae TaxID=2510796 RepID=A0A4Z0P6S5_9BACT|nr:hypothetical protein [Hymenobacter fodinae]TGE07710.1 hypothetical protein EU556_08120 [Hymenobacter fodinae]